MLIGTQMVAKGLDLPAVTLVGVISADIGLHIPDFRSGERTFQLLTQVRAAPGGPSASTAGRRPGSVVVQTYTPDNYAIVAAAEHDYASFFATEIALRREEAYPPFTRLARLVFVAREPGAWPATGRAPGARAARGRLAARPAGRRGVGAGAAIRPEVARPLSLADHGPRRRTRRSFWNP